MTGANAIRWLSAVLGIVAATMAAGDQRQLSFVVSYQGLFTAGLQVDIGRIDLRLEAAGSHRRELLMRASTREFDAAELLMPVRLCYRSQQDSTGGTRQADWWSRIGGKASRGRLLIDREQRRVLRLHSERKLHTAIDDADDGLLQTATPAPRPEQDWDETPFSTSGAPLDRLGMIQHLRTHPLTVGSRLQLPATNGRQLVGYEVEVEARERIHWNDRRLDTLRLRLQPVVKGDANDRPSWLWLSADADRLPLRLRSAHPHGSFEMQLVTDGVDTGLNCPVVEAVGLILPEA